MSDQTSTDEEPRFQSGLTPERFAATPTDVSPVTLTGAQDDDTPEQDTANKQHDEILKAARASLQPK